MNLDDAKVTIIGPPAPPADDKKAESIVIDRDDAAEVFEGEEGKCAHCGMDNAKQLPNGTCDICGNVWLSDEDSDFEVALDLLQSATNILTKLMKNPKVTRKLSFRDENEARSLVVTIDDFLDTYDFTETGTGE